MEGKLSPRKKSEKGGGQFQERHGRGGAPSKNHLSGGNEISKALWKIKESIPIIEGNIHRRRKFGSLPYLKGGPF